MNKFKLCAIDYCQREVSYKGITLKVPNRILYIATDSDGEVYGYHNKPRVSSDGSFWTDKVKFAFDNTTEEVTPIFIGYSKYKGNWEDSLVVIDRGSYDE